MNECLTLSGDSVDEKLEVITVMEFIFSRRHIAPT